MVLQKTELVRLQLFVKLCYKLASKFRKAEGKLKIKNPNLQTSGHCYSTEIQKTVKMSSPVYFEFWSDCLIVCTFNFLLTNGKTQCIITSKGRFIQELLRSLFHFFFLLLLAFFLLFFNSLTFLWKTYFFSLLE